MKKVFKRIRVTLAIFTSIFLFISCGGGSDSITTNEYLGDLPSIANNYLTKIDAKKEEVKQSTDMDKAFKLDKEYKLLKEEAENSVKDYIANNPTNNLPFEQKGDDPFTITDVSISQKYNSTPKILGLIAKVTITEDVSKTMFLYIKAIDKDGNQINKKMGVLATGMFSKKSFKVNQEVELTGGIERTADLVNFEKFVFVSREEYNKSK